MSTKKNKEFEYGGAFLNKKEILKKYFGYDNYRVGQEKIIDNILAGKDVLAVMPTGAGKSICYQIPALLLDGVALIVSPLISLMKDQVNSLTDNGIEAAFINSSLTDEEYIEIIKKIKVSKYKIVYVAPERLLLEGFIEFCQNLKVSIIAVDEAHCTSQWGQNFRSSYLDIPKFINKLPTRPPIAAFTATATREVREDIVRILELDNPFKITTGFDRPNLFFDVRNPSNKDDELLKIIDEKKSESGIIYCSTRKNVEQVFELLKKKDYKVGKYHGGMNSSDRKANQDIFINDEVNIMVATNAFGMGIDKSDLTFVIHYNMPKDIESYYQEAGRAGRDGQAADCILLYSGRDVNINRYIIENSEIAEQLDFEEAAIVRKREFERLKYMTFYSTTANCLREFILKYFGEKPGKICDNCSNCKRGFETIDITVNTQKILSCIYRCRENYGIGLISEVLKGSKNARIEKLGLNSISTYAIMSEYTLLEIREMIDWLVIEGYAKLSDSQYPLLQLGPKYKIGLKGEKPIELKRLKVLPKYSKSKTKISKNKSNNELIELTKADENLYEALKELRFKISKREKKPPYIIFTNRALTEMSVKKPKDLDEMLEINGVGEKKKEKYGEIFLEFIAEFLKENEV